jgi:hypothetical protein
MNTAAPSGVVTFLFTDIEGSTRRWEADAEAMRVALDAHNRCCEPSRRTGPRLRTPGDGMCAVFTSPRTAVDAAIAAQRAPELPVRIGIATGEAELHDGDYSGPVLNRTARLMAAGHGGQILLDGATAELLSGVDLVDLAPQRLRDIAKQVHVFRYPAGLRPLPALSASRPDAKSTAADHSFIGRDTAATIASTPGSSAYWPNNTNPSCGPWPSARRAVDHRLAQLYVIAKRVTRRAESPMLSALPTADQRNWQQAIRRSPWARSSDRCGLQHGGPPWKRRSYRCAR